MGDKISYNTREDFIIRFHNKEEKKQIWGIIWGKECSKAEETASAKVHMWEHAWPCSRNNKEISVVGID